MDIRLIRALGAGIAMGLTLAACGGGGGDDSPAATGFTVGGSVSGLASGKSVVLMDNGSDALTVSANGPFTFAAPIPANGAYAVTIGSQPTGQTCTVTNGSGSNMTANVGGVAVTCSDNPPGTANIGGTVSGLVGGFPLTLTNNGGDSLVVVANGAFTFATPVTTGSQYAVAIGKQPAGQTCSVDHAGGTASGAAVNTVQVSCSRSPVMAYLPEPISGELHQYALNADGSYTTQTTVSGLGSDCRGLAIGPTGRQLYLTCASSMTVDQFPLSSSGSVTSAMTATNVMPVTGRLAIDPAGRSACGLGGGNLVTCFQLDTSGKVVAGSGVSVPTGATPTELAFDPSGKFGYVVNKDDNTVSQYSVGSDGRWTPMSIAAVAFGTANTLPAGYVPAYIDFVPGKSIVYIQNGAQTAKSIYSIGPDGALTLVGTTTVVQDVMAFHPSGKYAYAPAPSSSPNTILAFDVNANGMLSPQTPSSFDISAILGSTGDRYASGRATVLRIDPLGQYLYTLTVNTFTSFMYSLAIGNDGSLSAPANNYMGHGSYYITNMEISH